MHQHPNPKTNALRAAESARVARTVAPLEALTRDIDAMVAQVHRDFPESAPGPHTRRVGDREGGVA